MSALSDKNRQKAEERILKAVTIKCKECDGLMYKIPQLYETALVGYQCHDCPHYYLFN